MTRTAREAFELGTKAFNAHDVEGFGELMADDAVCAAPGVEAVGKPACLAFYAMWLTAFPDARVEIHDAHVLGDVVIEEGTFSGTHKDVLRTPTGDLQPTGRRVNLDYIQVLRFRDGMTAAFHLSFDRLALLEQLGLVPTPVTAA
jgi:predicted ester cyclase